MQVPITVVSFVSMKQVVQKEMKMAGDRGNNKSKVSGLNFGGKTDRYGKSPLEKPKRYRIYNLVNKHISAHPANLLPSREIRIGRDCCEHAKK